MIPYHFVLHPWSYKLFQEAWQALCAPTAFQIQMEARFDLEQRGLAVWKGPATG